MVIQTDIPQAVRAGLSLLDSLCIAYGIFSFDQDANFSTPAHFRLNTANNLFCKTLGFGAKEDLTGKRLPELFPDGAEAVAGALDQVAKSGGCHCCSGEKILKDNYLSIHLAEAAPGYFLMTMENSEALRQIENTHLKHKLLVDSAQDIVLYIRGADARIIDANMAACQNYGYTLEELKQLTIHDIRHPSTRSLFEAQMEQADSSGVIFESLHRKKDGSVFPVEVSSKGTIIQDERIRIHIIRDISERKAAAEKIQFMATHDVLTGLINRGHLLEELELELARGDREQYQVAIIFCDVNKFKMINDLYGHHIGDIVLQKVAGCLASNARRIDLVARFGGDEFVIILPLAKGGSPENYAKRVFAALSPPIQVKDISVNITVSMGMVLFPDDGTQADKLLKLADQAMYRAKRQEQNFLEWHGRHIILDEQ